MHARTHARIQPICASEGGTFLTTSLVCFDKRKTLDLASQVRTYGGPNAASVDPDRKVSTIASKRSVVGRASVTP